MSDTGFGVPPTPAQLQVLLGDNLPPAEATTAAPGAAVVASRTDHVHPRLTSTTVQVLGAGGNVQVNFTRSFTTMPGVVCTAYKATDNLPVSFEVASWVMSGPNYVGCVIHGGKAQPLPVLTSILLLANLLTALNLYNPAAGDATGTQFSCVAIQASN